MVKTQGLIFTIILVFSICFLFVGTVCAQERVYYIDRQWTKIWINQDGTIDLFYHIRLALVSGSNINYVLVGQPQGDFTIGEAVDQHGHALATTDVSSKSDYKIQVNLYEPLRAGQSISFNLSTNVAKMIWEDLQNPGNVGMQFIPTWWEQASIYNLRISVVVPSGVTTDEVKTTSTFWNSTLSENDGRLALFWEKSNLLPNERYSIGVSFPQEYVQYFEKQNNGFAAFLGNYGFVLVFVIFSGLILAIILFVIRKRTYLEPKMSIETLGIRRGLTAVEASYLLDFKPTQIITEILYSLLLKRAIWVEATNPSLSFRILPSFQDKTGTRETPLRYYEIDFLNAVKDSGSLDEEKLAGTVMFLRDTVEQKLRGYCRQETIDYYRKIVTKAWSKVEQAGTDALASSAYDEHLLWLLLDPESQSRTEATFRNRTFEPSSLWFWYWYSYRHYSPHPTYEPNVETPVQSSKPPKIPGAEFADNIATAIEETSGNIVANFEKFANAILPMKTPKISKTPAHKKSGCVCACAACACACACVSCACACAGGGVG